MAIMPKPWGEQDSDGKEVKESGISIVFDVESLICSPIIKSELNTCNERSERSAYFFSSRKFHSILYNLLWKLDI